MIIDRGDGRLSWRVSVAEDGEHLGMARPGSALSLFCLCVKQSRWGGGALLGIECCDGMSGAFSGRRRLRESGAVELSLRRRPGGLLHLCNGIQNSVFLPSWLPQSQTP